MVSRETPDPSDCIGWDIYSTGDRGTEVRWRREPAEALALAFVLGGTTVPAGVMLPDTCPGCGFPILPDEPSGFDAARGHVHAGCCLGVTP